MKKLGFVFALIATNAFAGDVIWTGDTVIPSHIQKRMEAEVAARCQVAGRVRLEETRSSMREERIDQGVIDFFYSTSITVSERLDQYIFDEIGTVEVDVAEYSFSNPLAGDNVVVEGFRTTGNVVCR